MAMYNQNCMGVGYHGAHVDFHPQTIIYTTIASARIWSICMKIYTKWDDWL